MIREATDDEKMGMAWWNEMSLAERIHVLDEAERVRGQASSVSDAWALWKAGKIRIAGARPACVVKAALPNCRGLHRSPKKGVSR